MITVNGLFIEFEKWKSEGVDKWKIDKILYPNKSYQIEQQESLISIYSINTGYINYEPS